jgi:predicted acylesterase/phospholipase RssA
MAVPSSDEAIETLCRVIEGELQPEQLLRDPYLAEDTIHVVESTSGGKKWIWTDPPRDVGGYATPNSYLLGVDPESLIWRAPADVLGPNCPWSEQEKETYRLRSVDVTMRGGTTSGVVYPLAMCEIARTRRLRNVGGASAGAIAAAAAAAAELGRSSNLLDERYTVVTSQDRAAGRVRPGFVGLADTISWLCQLPAERPAEGLGRDHQGRDEYRLAQLFRPGREDRGVFACMTAAMRRQLWALPIAILLAFGWVSRVLLAAVFAAAVAVTAVVGARLPSWPGIGRPASDAGWFDAASLSWAMLDLALFFVALAGMLVFLPGLGRLRGPSRRGRPTPPWLQTLSNSTSRYQQADRHRSMVWRLIVSGTLCVVPVALALFGWWRWTAATLVGTAVSGLVAVIVGLSGWRYVSHANAGHYGLLAGSAPGRRRTLSELIAGTAKPTIELAVVPWLSDCLSRLAALEDGEVLRFGHLWLGRDYIPPTLPVGTQTPSPTEGRTTAERREQDRSAREACADPRRRLVNLELITTDLTRQRPYRFPLQPFGNDNPDAEPLYFRTEDLGAVERDGHLVPTDNPMFGIDVIEAMRDPHPVVCRGPDGAELRLHRLPDPWDLPVVFAVRLSMALPTLFKAVRLYRIRRPTTIRDDLGQPIKDGPKPKDGQRPDVPDVLQWPPKAKPTDPDLAEELWFSDGGITSNFPVHLFDAALPAWPTLGLNLGPHPDGFPHQDVWLPQDWQASIAPATEVRPPITSFVTAIVDTARSWRDTMQTSMPGSRGRVAWVRQRQDEGGTNLYMPREVIASLALRGTLAGARLARRFDNDTQWQRYRWLRLRVAVDNFQALRTAISINRPTYSDLTDGRFLKNLADNYAYDPYSEEIVWYRPDDDSFWELACQILVDFGGDPTPTPENDVLSRGGPQPHPILRQNPPM